MSRRNRENAFHQRGRFDYGTERKVSFQRIRRQARLRCRPLASSERTSEENKRAPSGGRVIQRLDSQPVARKKNLRVPRRFSRSARGTRIPNGKGKHPAEFAQALFAPFLIGVNNDFGIRVSAERVPAPFERLAQLLEIVDFAVENNRDIARFVEYRLVSARQVNDAEAAHPQRRRRSHQEPVFVRAAMPSAPIIRRVISSASSARSNSDDAADSAHSALLYREPARSSTLTSRMLPPTL